jgi:hypothetical protein
VVRAASGPMHRRGHFRHVRARSGDLQQGLHSGLRVRRQDLRQRLRAACGQGAKSARWRLLVTGPHFAADDRHTAQREDRRCRVIRRRSCRLIFVGEQQTAERHAGRGTTQSHKRHRAAVTRGAAEAAAIACPKAPGRAGPFLAIPTICNAKAEISCKNRDRSRSSAGRGGGGIHGRTGLLCGHGGCVWRSGKPVHDGEGAVRWNSGVAAPI